jgi:hypothetical protein
MKRIEDLTRDDIIARKAEARRDRARLSFGEKILVVERMREALAPFSARRERRRSTKPAGSTSSG